MGIKKPRQMSIWHFLMSNERGTIFKLLPRSYLHNQIMITGSKADFDAKSITSPKGNGPPMEAMIQDLNDETITEMP